MKQSKKIFTRMVINNWGGISHKVMEFHEYVNLFSGKSGSGKSTLLKLFMRFWDVNSGKIHLSGENIKEIPTCKLRNMESYVTQETALFHDSIYKNIAIAKENTTMEEVVDCLNDKYARMEILLTAYTLKIIRRSRRIRRYIIGWREAKNRNCTGFSS